MASKYYDTCYCVSLAILGYYVSLSVHRQLVAIRQTSEVTRHDKRPNISQQTEDALNLKALGELIQSPDPNIRDASIKIITDRAAREGPAWDMLMRDIAGMDIERRDKALAGLRFLIARAGKLEDPLVCGRRTYKALVDCLCNLLPEARLAEMDYRLRTQPERDALYVLNRIARLDVPRALEAGTISRWLVQYPFGGAGASNREKKNALTQIIDHGTHFYDTHYMTSMQFLLSLMSQNISSRKEMVEHGLLDEDYDVPEAAQMLWPLPRGMSRHIPVGTINRPREESFEEQALRRRRREAMVLGEVGRPIERADIIEPDSTVQDGFRSLFDELEEDSEQPVAAVADEVEEELEFIDEEITQTKSVRHGGWWDWLTRLRPDGLVREST